MPFGEFFLLKKCMLPDIYIEAVKQQYDLIDSDLDLWDKLSH